MPNPKQPPLFPGFADADQARGFKTKDEREYDRERKRKSKGKGTPVPKAPATGPACLRCARWIEPGPDHELGICRSLVRVNTRYARLDIEVGTVIHIDQADRLRVDEWSYLHTGEAFSCSAFASAADTGSAPLVEARPRTTLIDRVRKAS